jgi:hypothetical protein
MMLGANIHNHLCRKNAGNYPDLGLLALLEHVNVFSFSYLR